MDLECLDHVHFVVPDLASAKRIHGAGLRGEFVDDYGGPEMNAYGAWHTSGGDFIQPIDPEKPVFGGPPMPRYGMLSVSFRVADVDVGIEEAQAHGLVVRSRVGSEDIGLGKNVVQAQLEPEPVSGLPFELVEHQLPGVYVPLTEGGVDHVQHGVEDLDASARALEPIFGSAFEAAREDEARGMRTRRHAALGILLASPIEPSAGAEATAWRPGLTAIAYRCADLEAAVGVARGEGLEIEREVEGRGGREVDFAPAAGVAVRLVEGGRA